MPMLQRTPRKLLRQVANRPHAVDNFHNETAGIPSNPEKSTVDLAADPVSSSDEKAPILSSSPPPAQYEPPTRYGGRRVGIPKRGVFSSNTARKEQESAEDGAKGINNRGSGLPKEKSAGGTDSYDGSGGLDDFGEMVGPPSKKRKQNYTANVHASARPTMLGSSSKMYGRESTNGFKQPPSKLEAEKKKPTSFKVPNLYPLTQAKIASNAIDFKNPAPTSDSGSSGAVSDDMEVPNKKRSQNTETSYEEDTFDPAPCATSKREWRNIRQQAQDSSENTLSASNTKSSKTRKSLGLRKPAVTSKSPKKDAKKASNGSSTSSESGSTKLGFRMPAPLNTSGHSLSNPSSPKRFKQPNLHPNSSGSSSPLSSPPSSIFSSQPPPRPDSPQDPHCPLCRSPVSGDHLFAFQVDHPRMNVRMQAKFCREHKKRSAEATYIQRGYPRITWPQLDQRLQRHYPLLERRPHPAGRYHDRRLQGQHDGVLWCARRARPDGARHGCVCGGAEAEGPIG